MTHRARRLVNQEKDDAALRMLTRALAGIDPITAPPDRGLIDAALTYAALLADRCDVAETDETRLIWLWQAYRLAERGFGTHSDVWQTAASHYADLLAHQKLTGDAVTVRRRQLAAYRQHHQHSAVLSARRALATALYADGQCVDAHEEAGAALHDWRRAPGMPAASGQALLGSYLRMWAGCGQANEVRLAAAENADVFGPPRSRARETAIWVAVFELRTVEVQHAQVCELRPAHATAPLFHTDEERFDYWCALFAGETYGVSPSADAS